MRGREMGGGEGAEGLEAERRGKRRGETGRKAQGEERVKDSLADLAADRSISTRRPLLLPLPDGE
jgi:hypothetical protein